MPAVSGLGTSARLEDDNRGWGQGELKAQGYGTGVRETHLGSNNTKSDGSKVGETKEIDIKKKGRGSRPAKKENGRLCRVVKKDPRVNRVRRERIRERREESKRYDDDELCLIYRTLADSHEVWWICPIFYTYARTLH